MLQRELNSIIVLLILAYTVTVSVFRSLSIIEHAMTSTVPYIIFESN